MSTNGFREDELITRKMNGQTRVFPMVGGRLRLAHEENEKLSLQTELVSWDGQYAVFKCRAVTAKGEYVGYGTANAQRDSRLSESLIELAETRSIARALRFAGYGIEYTGAEEVSHVSTPEAEEAPIKPATRENVNNKPEAKPLNGSVGKATTAQVRALYALTKKAKYHEEDIESLIAPFQVSRFDDLPREAASHLISYLQTEVAA